MDAMFSSKTLVDFQQATWHYIAEERTLHDYVKSYIIEMIWRFLQSFSWGSSLIHYQPTSRDIIDSSVQIAIHVSEAFWILCLDCASVILF
jgi:adenylosuccinate lyase